MDGTIPFGLDCDQHHTEATPSNQVDVDLVIEHGDKLWGVEVKKAASIQPRDGKGLARLAEQVGSRWQGGMLLYTGTSTLPLTGIPNTFAVPLDRLWKAS